MAAYASMRSLGPVIVADWRLPHRFPDIAHRLPDGSQHTAVCLAGDHGLCWRSTAGIVATRPAGALLLDLGQPGEFTGDDKLATVLLVARRLLPSAAGIGGAARAIGASATLDGLRQLARGLLRDGIVFTAAQERIAGRAIAELLEVVLIPLASQPAAGATWREMTLLDRVVDHVDRHLTDDLDAAALCTALSCSRSALYRAVSAAGGVAALVNRQRLNAAHDLLCDPEDRRTVAAIGRASGFSDPVRFGRNFRLSYGVTPTQLRQRYRGDGPADQTER